MSAIATYRIWSRFSRGGSGDFNGAFAVHVDHRYSETVRALFPQGASSFGTELFLDVALVPEFDHQQQGWVIAIRAAERTIGFLDSALSVEWSGVIRRVIASGFVPVTACRIWAIEHDGFEGPEVRGRIEVALGHHSDAVPVNPPPTVPYTLLPRSSRLIHVTKEDQHLDKLAEILPASGRGVFVATLHETPGEAHRKPFVDVRIDDQSVGQLSPQMSDRFLPIIRHLRDSRGLVAACWSQVSGSPLAVEVHIDAIKANEATTDLLDGAPVVIPRLVPEQSDPSRYDLTAILPYLKPLAPLQLPKRPAPPEPPDGAVIHFIMGHQYNYLAARRGNEWHTTAHEDRGVMRRVMSWAELGPLIDAFGYATSLEPVADYDNRVRQHLAVVYYVGSDRQPVAAINIAEDGGWEGDWFSTDSSRLAFSEIALRSPVRVVTEWTAFRFPNQLT